VVILEAAATAEPPYPAHRPRDYAGLRDGVAAPDGVYDLTLNHAAVTDAAGQVLANDRADTFYRLDGDASGAMTVNAADNRAFSSTFGKSNGMTGFLAYFDYDGNGTINAADNRQFSRRFGTVWSGFSLTI
jgi:hypothetical protein